VFSASLASSRIRSASPRFDQLVTGVKTNDAKTSQIYTFSVETKAEELQWVEVQSFSLFNTTLTISFKKF
jgi:hypothetical protein